MRKLTLLLSSLLISGTASAEGDSPTVERLELIPKKEFLIEDLTRFEREYHAMVTEFFFQLPDTLAANMEQGCQRDRSLPLEDDIRKCSEIAFLNALAQQARMSDPRQRNRQTQQMLALERFKTDPVVLTRVTVQIAPTDKAKMSIDPSIEQLTLKP